MANSLNTPRVILQPFAEQGDKNAILDSPSTQEPQLANFQDGFPAVTSTPIPNGGIPPERADFNGLFNLMSSFYFFTQNGGTYTFNQAVSSAIGGYPKGARLYYTDNTGTTYIVESLINDNNNNFVANPSLIDGVNWKYVSSTPITNTLSANSASNVFSTQAIQNKFQLVNQLPQNPDDDTYYFIPE